MAAAAASMAAAETSSDGPVLNLMSKRLRALRKKLNRIAQMEEALAQGKTLNREQEEVLRSKPAVLTLIDEYEKLRAPLSAAVAEELSRHSASPSPTPPPPSLDVSDLVGLLYFGRLFDVQPQSDFTATMLTRTHERGCCLTYDYVTDDAVELLGERDLDEISALGALVTARPASATVSHKNALQGCVEHARLWLEHADQPIHPGASVTYAMLREKLGKIMASDYYTATPEMKAPDDVAAAVGKYNNACQVQDPEPTEPPVSEVQVDDYPASYEEKEDAEENDQETEVAPDQSSESSRADEPPNEESDVPNPTVDINADQPEQQKQEADQEQSPRDTEPKEQSPRDTEPKEQQYVPRRSYQNQRGGNRGGGGFGGRRGFPNGRGRGGRGGGGIYQNGRNQYYDNGYQRNQYFIPRGRGGAGGRFSGGNYHGGPPTHAGLVPAYAE